jgi:hypothetical protein
VLRLHPSDWSGIIPALLSSAYWLAQFEINKKKISQYCQKVIIWKPKQLKKCSVVFSFSSVAYSRVIFATHRQEILRYFKGSRLLIE